jgi:hypothetical protein
MIFLLNQRNSDDVDIARQRDLKDRAFYGVGVPH